MKNSDKLITSFDLSKSITLTFSERVFKEQKYIAITKYLCRESDPEPKPIGGIVLGTISFNQLAELLENSTEAVLDPTPKSIGVIKVKNQPKKSVWQYLNLKVGQVLILGSIHQETTTLYQLTKA